MQIIDLLDNLLTWHLLPYCYVSISYAVFFALLLLRVQLVSFQTEQEVYTRTHTHNKNCYLLLFQILWVRDLRCLRHPLSGWHWKNLETGKVFTIQILPHPPKYLSFKYHSTVRKFGLLRNKLVR